MIARWRRSDQSVVTLSEGIACPRNGKGCKHVFFLVDEQRSIVMGPLDAASFAEAEKQAQEMADDLGWERLGQGVLP